MASPTQMELRDTARAHLKNARILRRANSYDGAVYLCGYAVEIALKARICQTLKWPTFPPSGHTEFKAVFTHNIDPLLWFSGMASKIKPAYLTEWSVILTWKPELRYSPMGTKTAADADAIIAASAALLKILL